jgi:molybdate transport system regulatory protein
VATRSKKLKNVVIRGRAWIEIGGAAGLTEAGADLLEQIEACGSLSEAARRLRFNYRRAWLLVDAMNSRWPQPLVITATGGRRGGGSHLTDLGRLILRHFRDVQIQIEAVADASLQELKLSLRAAPD